VGFQNTKVNVVIMRGINDDELKDFVLFTSKYNVEVRFIELMSSGMKEMAEENIFITAEEIFQRIQDEIKLIPVNSNTGHGPAKTYKINGAKGVIGFISPVSKPFCGSCNRLRLTSDGILRSCLLSGGEVDIKSALRTNKGSQAIEDTFRKVADLKPASYSGRSKFTMQHIGG
jgi:cyclic pyranopterin phosphate synthase